MRALLLLLLALPARAEILPAPVRLSSGTNTIGSVIALQGTNPWNITGSTIIVTVASDITITTGAANIGTVSGSSVTAFQGGAWNVTGSTIIVSGGLVLSTGANNIGTVSGSSVAAQQLGAWSVGQQGSFTVTPGTGTWPTSASQAGSYTVTPGTGAFPASQSGAWTVGAAQQGSYTITPGTGTWGVSGANAGSYTVTPGTGTFPVSAAALPLPAGAATEATLSTLFQAGQNIGNTAFGASQQGSYTTTPGTGTWAVSGTFFQAVQPTAPLGSMTVTPGTGTFPVNGIVSAAQSGSYTTTPGTGTWPVSGTFFQAVQTVAPIGSMTVTPGTGTFQIAGSVSFAPLNGAANVTSTATTIMGAVTVTPGTGTFTSSQASIFTVTPGTGTWPVSISSNSAVTAYQSSAPWTTSPVQRQQASALKYFSTSSGFVTFAGSTESPLFLFVNLSTNTKCAYLDNHRISFAASNTGNGVAQFQIYRNSIITSSGTALGIFSGKPGSGALSQMQAYRSPVISNNGEATYSAASAGGTVVLPVNQSRIFCPGTAFLVTIDNPGNNFQDAYDIEWSEE